MTKDVMLLQLLCPYYQFNIAFMLYLMRYC